MSPAELRSHLEGALRKLGIVVRFEALQGPARRGGMCKVRGEPRIVVDARAPVLEQIATLEAALRTMDLEGIFLPPLVRARIEGRRRGTGEGPSVKKAEPR
jgi:hypothetical protein